jgi:MoxR-like ATPase
MSDWRVFGGSGKRTLPRPPRWRVPGQRERVLATTFQTTPELVDAVNTALYLRRPLLLTGNPGSGKSSLIYAVARKLALGKVLVWSITSRAVLKDGIYAYDALRRLQWVQQQAAAKPEVRTAGRSRPTPAAAPNAEAKELAMFLTLAPLGTALHRAQKTRALLIDEIDKSDVDLPNDLLNVLDSGSYPIPELKRSTVRVVKVKNADGDEVAVDRGEIEVDQFPFIVMTSNGERDFPAPFLRRCVQFQIREPKKEELVRIVRAHFGKVSKKADKLIDRFLELRDTKNYPLATDQVLNTIDMLDSTGEKFTPEDEKRLLNILLRPLS